MQAAGAPAAAAAGREGEAEQHSPADAGGRRAPRGDGRRARGTGSGKQAGAVARIAQSHGDVQQVAGMVRGLRGTAPRAPVIASMLRFSIPRAPGRRPDQEFDAVEGAQEAPSAASSRIIPTGRYQRLRSEKRTTPTAAARAMPRLGRQQPPRPAPAPGHQHMARSPPATCADRPAGGRAGAELTEEDK